MVTMMKVSSMNFSVFQQWRHQLFPAKSKTPVDVLVQATLGLLLMERHQLEKQALAGNGIYIYPVVLCVFKFDGQINVWRILFPFLVINWVNFMWFCKQRLPSNLISPSFVLVSIVIIDFNIYHPFLLE